jgi:hypothetical protein
MLALALILTAAPAVTAEATFTDLKALVGEWEAPVGKDGKVVRAEYKLVSNGTVLVETWTTPSGNSTMTVFHLDGKELLATHYCAQGNQPRLRWTKTTKGVLVFEFLDATNLVSPAQAHLVKLELGVLDSARTERGRLSRREVYVEAGKDDVSEFAFKRTR